MERRNALTTGSKHVGMCDVPMPSAARSQPLDLQRGPKATCGPTRWLVLLFGGWLACQSAQAQTNAAAFPQRVVDQLLFGTSRVYGILISRDATSVKFLVRRDWLKKNDTKLHDASINEIVTKQRDQHQKHQDRISKWLQEPPADPRIRLFLEDELNRIKENKFNIDDYPCLLLEVPQAKVKRLMTQSDEQRQLGLAAIVGQMEHVETKSAKGILRQMQQDGIQSSVSLATALKLAPPVFDQDLDWPVRRRLIEARYEEVPELVLAGSKWLASDANRDAGLAGEILAGLAGDSSNNVVDQLLNPQPKQASKPDEREWLKTGVKSADEKKLTAVRLSRLVPPVSVFEAKLESALLIKVGNNWKMVWHSREVRRPQQVNERVEQQIAEAPEIKQMLDLVGKLGVVTDELRKKIITFGAMNKLAKSALDQEAQSFLTNATQSIDQPLPEMRDI